jgi:hypothetical protein
MINFADLKKKVIAFVANIRIYKGGIILFGSSSYEFKGPEMREALNSLLPGDVLLRRYSHYLGSLAIPGYWSHAAFYVGANEVIHMLGKGIYAEDILTFMRCDDMTILRANNTNSIRPAIDKAYEFKKKGIEYDYDFDASKADKFYCTEFIDNCFGYPIRDRHEPGEIVIPDDFLNEEVFTEIKIKR